MHEGHFGVATAFRRLRNGLSRSRDQGLAYRAEVLTENRHYPRIQTQNALLLNPLCFGLDVFSLMSKIMIESLDIVRRLDEDPAFGPPALAPAAGRKDIDDWVASTAMLMRRLLRPRHAVTPLPEFQVKLPPHEMLLMLLSALRSVGLCFLCYFFELVIGCTTCLCVFLGKADCFLRTPRCPFSATVAVSIARAARFYLQSRARAEGRAGRQINR